MKLVGPEMLDDGQVPEPAYHRAQGEGGGGQVGDGDERDPETVESPLSGGDPAGEAAEDGERPSQRGEGMMEGCSFYQLGGDGQVAGTQQSADQSPGERRVECLVIESPTAAETQQLPGSDKEPDGCEDPVKGQGDWAQVKDGDRRVADRTEKHSIVIT